MESERNLNNCGGCCPLVVVPSPQSVQNLIKETTLMNTHAVAMLALASTVGTAMAADNPAGDTEVAELRALVSDLKSQVDTLKAQTDDNWLTEARATEIRGLVQDVLADADTRASLLQSGAVAGYDKNFFIGSADGNYMLKVAGQMQVRGVYNWQDDEGSADTNRSGFENRRTKLRFFGHVVDPSWQYLVLGAFERDGGSLVLDEAYITKDLGNGSKLRFGQFKTPFLREELVSSSRQMAVERSLVNEEFNQDRSQGIEYSYQADRWRLAAAFTDGFFPGGNGTDNTGWQNEDTEYAFTGRFEFMVVGDDWKLFDDFQGWTGGENGIMLGAAAHYQVGEYGTATTGEVESLNLTADVSAKFDRFGLFAAIVYRNLDSDDAATDVDQLGIVLQGGFFLTEDWELFGRYEWGDSDIDGDEDLSIITVGVNKYWNKHNLKWQNDIGFGLDEVSSTWSTSSAGWRTDPTDSDGQVVIRSQVQLLF